MATKSTSKKRRSLLTMLCLMICLSKKSECHPSSYSSDSDSECHPTSYSYSRSSEPQCH